MADTFIAIEHNTVVGYYIDGIWGQFFGITVHGSPDANNVGYVGMANNIITGSFYYAVVMGDGWIACDGRCVSPFFFPKNEERTAMRLSGC